MKKYALALACIAALAGMSQACIFGRRASVSCVNVTCQQSSGSKPEVATKTTTTTTTTTSTSTAQGVANLIVVTGRFRHWGGNPFAAEGIGMGPTPQAALQNCCFYGRRHIADVGYAQMPNGQWIAVARYR